MPKKEKPSYLNFDAQDYAWKPDIDYRKHPEKYRIGRGEQGVLICEPYKSEILPFWKFKNVDEAKKSSTKIYRLFLHYLRANDFVGADMARKYLQMGYTRARRYANYKGGRKYDKGHDYALLERGGGDPQKALSADIFRRAWKRACANKKYCELKKVWQTNSLTKPNGSV